MPVLICLTYLSESYQSCLDESLSLQTRRKKMLTVKYRLNNRFRPIEADPELLAAIAAAAVAPAPPPPVEPIVDVQPRPDDWTDDDAEELIEKIRQIE